MDGMSEGVGAGHDHEYKPDKCSQVVSEYVHTCGLAIDLGRLGTGQFPQEGICTPPEENISNQQKGDCNFIPQNNRGLTPRCWSSL